MLDGDSIRTAHLAPFNGSSFILTWHFIACILSTILGCYMIIRMYVFERLRCRSFGVE